jgi:Domain of unknown function (DUF4124)
MMIEPKKNHAKVLAALLLSTCFFSQAFAEAGHYRWIDGRGKPVYSDRPPPKGVDYEVISTSSFYKRSVDAEEGAVPAEVEPSAGNKFDQIDTKAETRSKKNPELCARAKANAEALASSDRIQIRNEQGEVRFLSQEELAAERDTARSHISVYCD